MGQYICGTNLIWIIIISWYNYPLGFSILLGLLPILDYIHPIAKWEIFPTNRIIVCLLLIITIIKYSII